MEFLTVTVGQLTFDLAKLRCHLILPASKVGVMDSGASWANTD
jgi:hypothetical protein